ncbi:hypothetical protein ACFSGX_14475 [Sphingomonas arantia]|uniref:Uncharacterized protein n=1 Tax=Sphingomonas arantia TaxID=1460676 RepID=A0ABW4TZ11_9SPHN
MMDEIQRKQAELVIRLHRLTTARILDWNRNEYEGNRLEARLGDMQIVLSNTNHEGTPFEIIEVWRNDNFIQSFNDGNLNIKPPSNDMQSYWHIMSSLRELAEQQSLKIEEHLDTLLTALDDLENQRPKSASPFDSDLDDDVPF